MKNNDYISLIESRMGQRRFVHSMNVAKAAVKLAQIYGADEAKAEIAGILHDCCKEISRDEMLQIMLDGGIILDAAEKSSSKLWHAIAGYVYARDVLKIEDEDILNSIRYHTTGRAGMSLLEKIIFTADFISDERNYDDVNVMREKAFKNLEDAMLYGLQFTIINLAQRNLPIHTNAINCFNEILSMKTKEGKI